MQQYLVVWWLSAFAELNLKMQMSWLQNISKKSFQIPSRALCLFMAETPGMQDGFSK